MRRFSSLCVLMTIALTMTACNQSADTHDADILAIRASETQWNQDYASKDPDKIMAHYADDAILMAPGAPASIGKDAIRNTIKEMESDAALSLQFQTSKIEVAKSGDLAYTQGSYTLTATDPLTKQLVHDHGSYVTTYRKQPDGTWKAVADIATSEVPPAAPQPGPLKKS